MARGIAFPDFPISWKQALGNSAARKWFVRKTGVPLARNRRQQKTPSLKRPVIAGFIYVVGAMALFYYLFS